MKDTASSNPGGIRKQVSLNPIQDIKRYIDNTIKISSDQVSPGPMKVILTPNIRNLSSKTAIM